MRSQVCLISKALLLSLNDAQSGTTLGKETVRGRKERSKRETCSPPPSMRLWYKKQIWGKTITRTQNWKTP